MLYVKCYMLCHVMSYYNVMLYVMSCHVMSYYNVMLYVMSCHVIL